MMMYVRPFQALQGSTKNLAVTATSQPLTLPSPSIGTKTIRILVTGTQTIFWSYDVAAVATVAVPMLAGTVETFLLPNDVSTINFIAAGTGSTVYVTIGESA